MLNEQKLRKKVEELNQQKLYNYIEWKEDDLNIGYHGQVTDGMKQAGCEFRLEGISITEAKLYLKIDNSFIGIMIVER